LRLSQASAATLSNCVVSNEGMFLLANSRILLSGGVVEAD
jgi:hypothetical protein